MYTEEGKHYQCMKYRFKKKKNLNSFELIFSFSLSKKDQENLYGCRTPIQLLSPSLQWDEGGNKMKKAP